ncbi:hypothetical protein DW906_10070 [Coprobacillus sp. AM42-12AC]|uniref:hypothetical protein n=1 Tax=Faecalibacillus faecis TaxID=1982628 RepID=UPI000E50EA53|nr:hypothetical protein DW906_10070 [Coprobacillus sp. AM42-12AC]
MTTKNRIFALIASGLVFITICELSDEDKERLKSMLSVLLLDYMKETVVENSPQNKQFSKLIRKGIK